MALICQPDDLVAGAGCLQCLTPQQSAWVQTYLLQQIAGDTHNPQELVALSKCFACLTLKQLIEVQSYLLCQLANS
jgi:hypothetical protein